ncbi:MAG: translation initiation factor IF-5A [Candidatus Aenigmarchaeota archaeon]|nr:translation initiation factor IF-5A [Candidatus Aenigmarchaeota archaeon]
MVTKPMPIKDLKTGHYVMAEGEPCTIVDIAVSKTGKHGSTKARIETMGIFDGRRRYILKPTSDNVEVPIIEKKKAQVISISGTVAQLMDLEDYSTFDATIPEELAGKIEAGKEVGYWRIEGRTIIKEVK